MIVLIPREARPNPSRRGKTELILVRLLALMAMRIRDTRDAGRADAPDAEYLVCRAARSRRCAKMAAFKGL
jgi:hypothetical protein